MKTQCRCGHGRARHSYTTAGLRYARKHGTIARQPCHGYDYVLPSDDDTTPSGKRFVPCRCRNWHEVVAPHDFFPEPVVDGDETGARGVACMFCGKKRHA